MSSQRNRESQDREEYNSQLNKEALVPLSFPSPYPQQVRELALEEKGWKREKKNTDVQTSLQLLTHHYSYSLGLSLC